MKMSRASASEFQNVDDMMSNLMHHIKVCFGIRMSHGARKSFKTFLRSKNKLSQFLNQFSQFFLSHFL